MSDKEKIIKLYKEKIKKFKLFNKAYFEKDQPIVQDSKFDELKVEILKLEKQYSYLKKIESISNIIGFKPSKKF